MKSKKNGLPAKITGDEKMNRKTIFLLLLVLNAVYVYSQHFDNENNFRWSRSGNSIKIIEYIGQNTDVRIPPQIRGLPVTEIGNGAFHARGLVNVSIPDNVVTIGDWAFSANQQNCVRRKLHWRVTVV